MGNIVMVEHKMAVHPQIRFIFPGASSLKNTIDASCFTYLTLPVLCAVYGQPPQTLSLVLAHPA